MKIYSQIKEDSKTNLNTNSLISLNGTNAEIIKNILQNLPTTRKC